MEAHRHILYEETFKRIATVLDVIAESQGKHEERMQLHDERMDLHGEQMAQHEKETAEIRSILKQTAVHMDALAVRLEVLAVKSAESEDKLNALITLMDEHMHEGRKN
jgi:hypothetical protein